MSALLDAVPNTATDKAAVPVSPERHNAAGPDVPLSARALSLLILADDLSGAADCAATALRHGARAMVALSADAPLRAGSALLQDGHGQNDHHAGHPVPGDHDVLAIDLDSRRMTASEAAQVHRDAVRGHRKAGGNGGTGRTTGPAFPATAGVTRIFKKVDSTLRGHVAAEVAALVPLVGLAIVAPALPEAGRTTEAGRQLLHGVPVEETEVWRNEKIAGTADLVAMLRAAGLRVAHQAVSDTTGDAHGRWRHAMESARAEGAEALVCDAVTKADLDAIARASIAMRDVFWAGSAGLARSLTQALADAGIFAAARLTAPTLAVYEDDRGGEPVDRLASTHGALFVVGSMSSISHAQITSLQSSAGDTLRHVAVDVADLLGTPPGTASAVHRTSLAQITAALQAGDDVVVSLAQQDRSYVGDGYRLAQAFGGWLSPVVTAASAVFATGGETARALFSAAAIDAFTLDAEIAPGVPISWTTWASRGGGVSATSPRRIPIVTKAGAFGNPDTLVHVWRYLNAHKHRSS